MISLTIKVLYYANILPQIDKFSFKTLLPLEEFVTEIGLTQKNGFLEKSWLLPGEIDAETRFSTWGALVL